MPQLFQHNTKLRISKNAPNEFTHNTNTIIGNTIDLRIWFKFCLMLPHWY
jgi:hypothetical protein